MKTLNRKLPIATALLALSYMPSSFATTFDCPVDSTWLTNPSFPTEVATSGPNGSSTFCDFYQFSTQAYLYLMSPVNASSSKRNFQDNRQFPLLEHHADGSPANSCDNSVTANTLKTGLDKNLLTGQAGGGSSIYDTSGNVAYYDVRFNRDLCSLTGSAVELKKQNRINFPSGTVELKFAWKELSNAQTLNSSYVLDTRKVNGVTKTFGLLGMHIAVATKNHPEFVWATYEHKLNSPNCDAQGPQDNKNWTFADKSCTSQLPSVANSINSCNFNNPTVKNGPATSAPTNICRVYPYGTATGDNNASVNLANIVSHNGHVETLLSGSSVSNSMKLLKNYFNVGAIWLSDITKSSGGIGVPNERGSLRLANSVAETDYQHVDLNASFSSNCFGCHNYNGTSETRSNNITSQALSHIFQDILAGQGKSVDVNAISPIANNAHAKKICGGDPNGTTSSTKLGTCKSSASFLKWNGNWTNINQTSGSVCGCSPVN